MYSFNQTTPTPSQPQLMGFPVSKITLEFSLESHKEYDIDDESQAWCCLRAEGELSVDGLQIQGKGSFELGTFLYQVLKRSGGFDLFNCSCGVAGCAGIDEKVLLSPLGSNHLALILPAQDYWVQGHLESNRIESNKAQKLLANFPSLLENGKKVFYESLKPGSLIFVLERQPVVQLARNARRFIRQCEIETRCYAYPYHGHLFSAPDKPFHVELSIASRRHRANLYFEAYREEVYGQFIGSYVYLKSTASDVEDGAHDDRDLFISSLPDFINSLARFQEGIQTDGFAQMSDTLKLKEKDLFANVSQFGFHEFILQLHASEKEFLSVEFHGLNPHNLPSLYISSPRFTWLTPSTK